MNFLACGPGSACCLQNEWDKIDVWVPVELGLLCSLGRKTWFCTGSSNQRRIAREGSNYRDVQICDSAMKVKDEVNPRTFRLSVDNTSEGRYFLFNEYFDPTV